VRVVVPEQQNSNSASAGSPTRVSKSVFCGLITYKERWGISGRGWIALLGTTLLLLFGLGFAIHPFLATTNRLPDAEFLVVEGWVPDYAMKESVKEFRSHHYNRILVTGEPLARGSLLAEYGTFAELGAATLLKLGLDTNIVVAVPAPYTRRGRTFESASAVADWFQKNHFVARSLNIVTVGAHSRRSRLLYCKVFGPQTAIGVISIPTEEYDPARWWHYSAGLRAIIGETSAYLNARLFGR